MPSARGIGSALRSAFNSVRGDLSAAFNPETESPDLHRSTSRGLTEKGVRYGLSPTAAALGADTLGLLNETVAGYLAPTLDKPQPFFSHSGYDIDDIQENRKGQDEALAASGRRIGIPLTSPLGDAAIYAAMRGFVQPRSAPERGHSLTAAQQATALRSRVR